MTQQLKKLQWEQKADKERLAFEKRRHGEVQVPWFVQLWLGIIFNEILFSFCISFSIYKWFYTRHKQLIKKILDSRFAA